MVENAPGERQVSQIQSPLADRMRPRSLDEFIGQDEIIGPGRLLRRAIQADQLSSIIFFGPPGTGKTTLARIIANTTSAHFTAINAVLSGVKEIRSATETAQQKRNLNQQRTILFVDEVHRFNKSQQDALLPWVENGTVIRVCYPLGFGVEEAEEVVSLHLSDFDPSSGAIKVHGGKGGKDRTVYLPSSWIKMECRTYKIGVTNPYLQIEQYVW